MQYRTLGRTGLKVSAITMGTFTFGGRGAFSRAASQSVEDARSLVDVRFMLRSFRERAVPGIAKHRTATAPKLRAVPPSPPRAAG